MAASLSAWPVFLRLARAFAAGGDVVRGLSGWRRFLFAVVTGLLSALAFAPYGIFPLLLIAFAVLVLLIDGAAVRPRPLWNAGFVGWSFGFGHFLAGLYWVAYAFLVDPGQHAWQIPFVLTLFPAGLAIFPALASAAAAWFWRPDLSRIFVFTVSYTIAEYLRGHIFTGFPWNLPAYGWGASLGLLQSASVIGAYGLSLLTILLGAALALFADRARSAAALPAALIAAFVLIWGAGLLRLDATPTVFVPGVHLRLVQPDVPQDEKFVPQERYRNWLRLIDLSRKKSGPAPTHIIWPEAAPPFFLARTPWAMEDVAHLDAGKTVLMTGAERVVLGENRTLRFYNSFFIFGPKGNLRAAYDKFHLVPFGEYLPMAGLLHSLGLSKLVDMPGSFSFGDGPHTYPVAGAPPVGPLICYEVIFPGAVIGKTRPGWLVNVTDDSWFGPPGSSGPPQHLLTARVRAIEEGLPIARAANTGISATIDPAGRLVSSLGMGRMGVVDSGLPAALSPTLYARFGDLAFFILLISCGCLAWIGLRRGR
jgi:apolipoprotein N-acyltransferase